MTKRQWRRMALWCAFASVASFWGSGFLEDHYLSTRPPAPDAAAGRIHRVSSHGTAAYLTSSELAWRDGSMVAFVILFGLAALAQQRARSGSSPEPSPGPGPGRRPSPLPSALPSAPSRRTVRP